MIKKIKYILATSLLLSVVITFQHFSVTSAINSNSNGVTNSNSNSGNNGNNLDSSSTKDAISTQQSQIQGDIDALKGSDKAKLSGSRYEACQAKEDKINSVNNANMETSQKQLTALKTIQERIQNYFTNKNLSSSDYNEAVMTATERYTTAMATVQASVQTKFSCSTTDADSPGNAIKTMTSTRLKSLNGYRDAIKRLLQLVEKADVPTTDITQVEE